MAMMLAMATNLFPSECLCARYVNNVPENSNANDGADTLAKSPIPQVTMPNDCKRDGNRQASTVASTDQPNRYHNNC